MNRIAPAAPACPLAPPTSAVGIPVCALVAALALLAAGCGGDDPTVVVTSPAGGPIWETGAVESVTWTSSGLTSVRVELTRDGTWADVEIIALVDAASGAFDWTVTGPPSTECRFRVRDAFRGVVSSESDPLEVRHIAWKVDAGADPGGDGYTWESAFAHPRDGVDAAAADATAKEVWVAAGDYYRVAPATEALAMADGVAVYGGFAGGETSLASRNWAANLTRLDGEGTYRVVVGASNAALDGFTVTGGSAVDGAGMLAVASTNLAVANCAFEFNAADTETGTGGGIHGDGSSLVVTGCTFQDNAALHGAGIYGVNASSVTLDTCTFTGNTASNGAVTAGQGGGVRVLTGSITAATCTFSGNQAASAGGGMYAQDCALSLTGCTFDGNATTAAGDGDLGGGLYVRGTPSGSEILTSTFRNNGSGLGGGIYSRSVAQLEVTRCVFDGNAASYRGGAGYSTFGSVTRTNCLYVWNTATDMGGALFLWDHTTTIAHCTFCGNAADDGAGGGEGGAIFKWDANPPITAVVRNSILWGDSAGADGPGIWSTGSMPTAYDSDIEQGGGFTDGGGNLNTDPLFVSQLGPDTLPGTGDENFHLQTSPAPSPCIDAGATLSPEVTDDLEGAPRSDGQPDMGAYEDG